MKTKNVKGVNISYKDPSGFHPQPGERGGLDGVTF